MCGIAGIVDLMGARDIDRDALKRMSAALRHRGPDGEGSYIAPGVGFAHRRLAIIDREGGAQPFKILSRKGVLNFNGEIYNYETLARELAGDGVALSTRSDTETLAEGLAHEGRRFVEKLRGMFAFAYWDVTSETLTLCRDRLGEKPLYYAVTHDGFLLYASEVGAIAKSGLVSLDLDDEAVADYFLYGFVPDPKSIFANIRKLAPASILTAARGQEPSIERYWRPQFQPAQPIAFNEAQEQLLALLDDAVRAEMIADAPLGAFLSGGVDSSAVVASMARADGAVKTCAIGFDEDSHDERAYARIVARLYGADHVEDVAQLDAAALIDEIARVYGEPFADSSALPTYMVAKLARDRVTVALSGDGGDEIFAGYRRHPFFVNEERLRSAAPLALRQATFGAAGAVYPKLDWAPRPVRWKATLQALGASRASAYAQAVAANRPDRARRMLSPDLKRSLGGYRPESVIEAAMDGRDEPALVAAQRADFAVWLPGRMLTKVDRASMAHGLEVRPPLLDIKLVEWTCRLPPEFKLSNGEGKRIFKAALKERLPRDIIDRKKQGFAPPLAQWMRDPEGPLRRLAEAKAWRQSGYLSEPAVDAMAKAHAGGAADMSQELWTVVMFDAFLKNAAEYARA
ncbi:MAG TPA: asparagine synthase (glutamine-hydrolyzing) [Parvularculaceae bacterium]|nr:asparagine synthase (glutamine-hydrolyzing) [Parvularculaceae bacterium]